MKASIFTFSDAAQFWQMSDIRGFFLICFMELSLQCFRGRENGRESSYDRYRDRRERTRRVSSSGKKIKGRGNFVSHCYVMRRLELYNVALCRINDLERQSVC